MSRTRGKSIDQIEKQEASIFAEQPVDKRKETKEFVVERDPSGLYIIKYTAGGEVPDACKGKWTSIGKAQERIKCFLAERKQKDQVRVEQ